MLKFWFIIPILLCGYIILILGEKYGKEKDEFVEKLINKYDKLFEKIEFNTNDNQDEIKGDMCLLLEYDMTLGKNVVILEYDKPFREMQIIRKYRINGNEAYWGYCAYYGRYTPRYSFSIVRKIKINGRLHIETQYSSDCGDDVLYGNGWIRDKRKYMQIYDSKYFKNIENALSENFYKKNFQIDNNSELIELNSSMINKLVDIFEKYSIRFQIVIKDNCLRINTFTQKRNDDVLEKLELCNYELIKFCDELERQYKK